METVKDRIIALLSANPMRFSELATELMRPDKTIYVALKELTKAGLVIKGDNGYYYLTENGYLQLPKARLRIEHAELAEFIEDESDLSIIMRAKIALALKRTYDVVLYAKRLAESNPDVKTVSLDELDRMLERIRSLIVMEYSPGFDAKAEEEKERKYHSEFPQFADGIFWRRIENIAKLRDKLPEGKEKELMDSALGMALSVEHVVLLSDTPDLLEEYEEVEAVKQKQQAKSQGNADPSLS